MSNQFGDQQPKQKNTVRKIYAADIDRPIHQFSSRCDHSLQLCENDNTSKPPTCKFFYSKLQDENAC